MGVAERIGVNDTIKVIMIKWRVPLAVAPESASHSPTTRKG